MIQERLKLFIQLLNREFGLLSFGHVAGSAGDCFHLAVFADYRHEDVIIDPPSIRTVKWHFTPNGFASGNDGFDFPVT